MTGLPGCAGSWQNQGVAQPGFPTTTQGGPCDDSHHPHPGQAPDPTLRLSPWDRSSPQWIDIDQRLPHDHLARLIDAAVALLDLQPLLRSYAGKGSKAYHPALMLRILLCQL